MVTTGRGWEEDSKSKGEVRAQRAGKRERKRVGDEDEKRRGVREKEREREREREREMSTMSSNTARGPRKRPVSVNTMGSWDGSGKPICTSTLSMVIKDGGRGRPPTHEKAKKCPMRPRSHLTPLPQGAD